MFCERCGRILKPEELVCPECGAYYGPPENIDSVYGNVSGLYILIPFLITAVGVFFACKYFGPLFLFFFLFFSFGGRPRTKLGAVVRGVFLGAMVGGLIGMTLSMFGLW